MLDKDFYLKYMSMFLKNSYGIIPSIETYYEILKNIDSTCTDVFNRFNIFSVSIDDAGNTSPNYFDLNKDLDPLGKNDTFLDIIAAIFGVTRTFKITYTVPLSDARIAHALGVAVDEVNEEELTLTNYELLIYIQLMVVKNNYDGTLSSLSELYRTGFKYADGTIIKTYCANDLKLRYEPDSTSAPLHCTTRLTEANVLIGKGYTSLIKMFYAGYLTINSLGIVYTRTGFVLTYPAFFYTDIFDSSITSGAIGRFYNELNILKNLSVINNKVNLKGTNFLLFSIAYILDDNDELIPESDYTFDEETQEITFTESYSTVSIYGYAEAQLLIVDSQNPSIIILNQNYQYSTLFVTKILINDTINTDWTFDSIKQTITFTGTEPTTTDVIYAFCDPVHACFS